MKIRKAEIDAMRSTAVYHIGENAAKAIQDKAFEAMLLAAIGFGKARKDAKRQKRAQSPEPEVIKGEFHGPCVFFTVPDWAKPGMVIRISPD
jgi:hypothetical protein